MKKIGYQAFQVDWEMPCLPRSVSHDMINKTFGYSEKCYVLKVIYGFSKEKGVWCGVTLQRALVEVFDMRRVESFKQAIEELTAEGLLIIKGRWSGPLSVINWFFPGVICPTSLLVTELMKTRELITRNVSIPPHC